MDRERDLDQFKDTSGAWLTGASMYTMLGLVLVTMLIIWGLPKITKSFPKASKNQTRGKTTPQKTGIFLDFGYRWMVKNIEKPRVFNSFWGFSVLAFVPFRRSQIHEKASAMEPEFIQNPLKRRSQKRSEKTSKIMPKIFQNGP